MQNPQNIHCLHELLAANGIPLCFEMYCCRWSGTNWLDGIYSGAHCRVWLPYLTVCWDYLMLTRTNSYGTLLGTWCQHTQIMGHGWWLKETMRLKTILSWKALCLQNPLGHALQGEQIMFKLVLFIQSCRGSRSDSWILCWLQYRFCTISMASGVCQHHCLSVSVSLCLSLFSTQKFRTMIQCHVIFHQLDVLSLYIWSSPL